MVLYAWVGEDEFGSGEVGLKQGLTAQGLSALVSCKEGKIDLPKFAKSLQKQASTYGKTIRLCRFVFDREVIVLRPGS